MAGRFGAGLFPLHSPLLRESWLVSFPPLTDMLKFSGYPRLIRGRMCETTLCTAQAGKRVRLLFAALLKPRSLSPKIGAWGCQRRRSSATFPSQTCAKQKARSSPVPAPLHMAAKREAEVYGGRAGRCARATRQRAETEANRSAAMTCSPTLGQAWLWQ